MFTIISRPLLKDTQYYLLLPSYVHLVWLLQSFRLHKIKSGAAGEVSQIVGTAGGEIWSLTVHKISAIFLILLLVCLHSKAICDDDCPEDLGAFLIIH